MQQMTVISQLPNGGLPSNTPLSAEPLLTDPPALDHQIARRVGHDGFLHGRRPKDEEIGGVARA